MKKNKLVVMCGLKYEPEWMLDQLKENLSWADDFAVLDCRDRDELWMHEGEYRAKLRDMARKMGADWVMWTSPDERWEKNAGKIIRPLIDYDKSNIIYEFDLREMYTPNSFRWDGIWGTKVRRRLYPLGQGQVFAYKPIQCPSTPQDPNYEIKHLDVNIYHLKMIERENRRLRAEVFKKLDPNNDYQHVGYDYLDDEKGILLKEIMPGREYFPEYKKYEFKVPARYLVDPQEQ